MYSKAKIADHPIHPMIVAFPITFYTLTPIAYGIYQFGSHGLFWYHLAFFSNIVGVITAVLAAVPGFIDWAFGIPNTSAAKSRGLLHMGLNVAALILFVISGAMLLGNWDIPLDNVVSPFVLSVIGALTTGFAGYHGWELIATHKVGVTLTPEQERLEPVEEMSPEAHKFSKHPRTV
jgi:uncharacterized membrane protein